MNRLSNYIWGLLFVILGIVFGLNALEITDIDVFFDGWWTLFIIIPCFVGLFQEEKKTGNLIGLFIGIWLFLCCRDIVSFWLLGKLIVPIILVLVGLSLLFKDSINKKVKTEIKKLSKDIKKEYCSTFSSQVIDLSNEKFEGCNVDSIFGGVKIDLKDVVIDDDVVINATSIFGGITIYVPQDINIKVSSTSIFGGVSDERRKKTKDAKKTIYINGTCLFGGVEIK